MRYAAKPFKGRIPKLSKMWTSRPTRPPLALTRGERIGRFEIDEELGRGAGGVVFKAHHVDLRLVRALKVLSEVGPDAVLTASREGRLQAKVSHPNLLGVEDFFVHGGRAVLVMQYVAGGDLNAWMAERRPRADEGLQIFLSILDGVAALHESGMVHRDIKPSNILISCNDGDPRPLVSDFGLAMLMDDAHRGERGAGWGTPPFAAPEQLAGMPDLDQRVDIYALGKLLHQMVYGVPQGDPLLRPPQGASVALFERVDAAILAATAPSRDERPRDCTRLRDLLADSAESAKRRAEHRGFSSPRAWRAIGVGLALLCTVLLMFQSRAELDAEIVSNVLKPGAPVRIFYTDPPAAERISNGWEEQRGRATAGLIEQVLSFEPGAVILLGAVDAAVEHGRLRDVLSDAPQDTLVLTNWSRLGPLAALRCAEPPSGCVSGQLPLGFEQARIPSDGLAVCLKGGSQVTLILALAILRLQGAPGLSEGTAALSRYCLRETAHVLPPASANCSVPYTWAYGGELKAGHLRDGLDPMRGQQRQVCPGWDDLRGAIVLIEDPWAAGPAWTPVAFPDSGGKRITHAEALALLGSGLEAALREEVRSP